MSDCRRQDEYESECRGKTQDLVESVQKFFEAWYDSHREGSAVNYHVEDMKDALEALCAADPSLGPRCAEELVFVKGEHHYTTVKFRCDREAGHDGPHVHKSPYTGTHGIEIKWETIDA